MFRKIYFLLLLNLAFIFSKAQVSDGMNYQCVVRNSAGVPVSNTVVKIRFSILPSMGSSADYTEEQVFTTNILGLITANIGHGIPVSGQFSSIDWTTETKFLKVETDIGNTGNYTDAGTTQLLWVPFAMVARKTTGGTTYQTFLGSQLIITARDSTVFSNDSLVVNESGTYLITVDAEGYGSESNDASVGYGDNLVYLKVYNGANLLLNAPLHDSTLDKTDTRIFYNLTPHQTTKVITTQLTAGNVIHPAVRIGSYGTGQLNTNALGYGGLTIVLVKLR